MSTSCFVDICGIQFEVPPPENKTSSLRGRKSPAGKQTGVPFNEFVWQLLYQNAKRVGKTCLTDNQLLDVILQEFSDSPKIKESITNKPGTYLSYLRSHFNRNILRAGWRTDYPSFSMKSDGTIINPDSGQVLSRSKILEKLVKLHLHPDLVEKFMLLVKQE